MLPLLNKTGRPSAAALIFFVHLVCFSFFTATAQAQQYSHRIVIRKDGIVIYPRTQLSGNAKMVRLQVISDRIIRVTASPSSTFADSSLITVYHQEKTAWQLIRKEDKAVLQTSALSATVLLSSGAVAFTDRAGKPLLAEQPYGGRQLLPAVFEGKSSHSITQVFQTTADDAWYGLGQHQSDQFNYKGEQVTLFQNNTEVAVPFLVSAGNYGILWDNYSLTKVGDSREYLPLSALQLFSKEGEAGWLTAAYRNDSSKPDAIAFAKTESDINYPFLGDTKSLLPPGFNPQRGSVTWEGAIATAFNGQHIFRFTYAGYIRVWINGQLQLDRWRQAWNPGTGLVKLNLEGGKKYSIKMEWRPDGGESYLSVKWIHPLPEAASNTFAFVSEAGRQLDYYFIYGKNMDGVIAGYRKLTGKAPIVPKWAMGFWQSRERYKTAGEILATVDTFRQRKIPLDNIVLDWSYWKQNDWGSQDFDSARFPAPDSMIAVLHNKYKAHFMISVWPKFYEGIPTYRQFAEKGWLYRRNIADSVRDWIGAGYVSTFYDAFNEEARKGFWNLLHKKLYSKGVDAWWMDASEPDILSNVSPARRKAQMTPLAAGLAAEYLNAYPLENAKGIYNGQRSVDRNKRVFLLTRSGFAGSQHYAAAVWSGDIASRWEDMKAQISAGLNFSLSGLPYWTMDIGGFSVEKRYEKPNAADREEWRELQTRWYQFGAFVPLFRVHGQAPYREIFNLAPETHPAYQSMLYYNRLRYRLMPYLYTLAGDACHNDYTIMRALVMDFGKDTAVRNCGDQYMLGPSLLVAPVYSYKARSRTVYLPAGQGWYSLYDGRYTAGGRTIMADAPYERMPLFVKEGSIIPIGPELQYTSEKKADTITLFVYTGRDAAFTLYEDEEINYSYEKGAFSRIGMHYNEAGGTLTLESRKGRFPGMPESRVFNIVWIDKKHQLPLVPDSKGQRSVVYKGAAITIRR